MTEQDGDELSHGDLPTIEYVTRDGRRRQLDFQRDPNAPWRAVLVEREDDGDGNVRCVGSETLRELKVDGEQRTARNLPLDSDGAATTIRGP